MPRRALVVVVVLALLVVLIGGSVASTYNALIGLDQDVQGQWAQVETAYQRRADLIPNLVETVKAAAAHERDTLVTVTEARARVGGLPSGAGLAEFQAAQDQLSSALGRLLAVAEAYPQLRANENFLALQSQLEGTENRIAVERRRYNDAARAFNTRRDSFPTVVIAGAFGERFAEKPYFAAQAGAAEAPKVKF